MAKLNVILRDAGGNSKSGYRVVIKDSGGQIVADTNELTIIDNGDGTYVTSTDVDPGTYDVYYSPTGSGTLAPVPGYESFPFGGAITGTIPIENGGTGADNITDAQTNLGVLIGTNVQAYSANLKDLDDSIALLGVSNGVAVYDGATETMSFIDIATGQAKLGLAKGSEVQEYSSVLQSLADLATPAGDVFPYMSNDHKFYNATSSSIRTKMGLGSVATVNIVPIEKGGTNASDFDTASINLKLQKGVDIQVYSTLLDDVSNLVLADPASYEFLMISDTGIEKKKAVDVLPLFSLGTVIEKDFTTTGETLKVPVFTSEGMRFPIYTRTAPTPSSSNVGLVYFKRTGTFASGGKFGMYCVSYNSNLLGYTYETKTIFETTW